MQHYDLAGDATRQLFETVASYPGSAVFVHCGVLTVGARKRLGLPSRFDLRVSNPIHLHALAGSFPKVPVIIPHFGAGMFREALMLADLCPNVYLDTSSSNGWIKYFSELSLSRVFAQAIEVVGPERLLFGTDSSFFPRGWNRPVWEAQTSALEEIGLGDAAREQILWKNFDRLFPV
jgi:predicted TIM-barrel fold metal-dependent hydrolase